MKSLMGLLFCFVSLGMFSISSAQNSNLKLKQLSINDGLSHNRVTCIIQDKQGFLWFGTNDGLNKYDGYNFTVYQNNPNDSSTITNNSISNSCLLEDSDGDIWVGTNGLNRFNKLTEKFTRYSWRDITSSSINCIYKDLNQNLWVGTYSGINLFDKSKNQFIKFRRNMNIDTPEDYCSNFLDDGNGNILVATKKGIYVFNPQKKTFTLHSSCQQNSLIANSQIMDLMEDCNKNLWISTIYNGVFCYSKEKQVKHYKFANEHADFKSNNNYFSFQDKLNNLWFGTDVNGLYKLSVNDTAFLNYRNNENDNNSIASNSVFAAYEDNSGLLWFCTANGISYLNRNVKFEHYRKINNSENSLTNNFVTCFAKDSKGNMWIGTDGGGLCLFDIKTGKTTPYAHNKQLKSLKVIDLAADNDGKLWVGTWAGGLYSIDVATNRIINYLPEKGDEKSISTSDIMALTIDNNNNLWVATFLSGLDYFNKKNETFVHFRPTGDNNSLTNYVYALITDRNDNIWVGNLGTGINRLEYNKNMPVNKENVKVFRYTKSTATSQENINVFCEDSDNNLWIGTQNGLVFFDYKNDSTKVYNYDDGLPNNTINGILEDQHKNLWISTNKGISRFNIKNKEFKNYDVNDGLQSNQFNIHACFKDVDGTMYFGGINGFNVFHPDSIKDNTFIPPVYITDFKIFKESIPVGVEKNGRIILPMAIPFLNEIELLYNESMITFEFAALNYISPEKNQYAYILEGFDKTMHYVGTERSATYTNLPQGDYVFRVIASNNDGIWNNEGTSIKIIVLPPWYKTWWAYLTYGAIMILTIYLIRQSALVKEKNRSQIALERLEFIRNRELNQKTIEVEQMKLRFFTNISHEFRTPLTLIMGLLDYFYKNKNSVNWSENERFFNIMKNNAQRLLQIINKILDVRKLETGKMKVFVKKGDIVIFVKSIAESYAIQADKRNIQYTIQCEGECKAALFDNDMIDKIVFNLLSNAFKFTSDNGEISICTTIFSGNDEEWNNEINATGLNYSDSFIKISVCDNGVGIPNDQFDRIFERFYQTDDIKSHSGGSGIGLSLVKEFLDLCSGKTSVESSEGKGSNFIVWLPIGNDLLELPEIEMSEQVLENESYENQFYVEDVTDEEPIAQQEPDEEFPLILIVEDNQDMQSYLAGMLKPKYRVITANNGKIGLEKAMDTLPDLIICDIMMPEMSGTELCHILKNDEYTSHIPIILLTARTSEYNFVEGIETGADEYITKPFSIAILEAKVKNIIRIREKLKEKFGKGDFTYAKEITANTIDEKFLQKAIDIVTKNISDCNFSNELLGGEMAMSRTQLYKKIKAITNQSVNEFIRTIRLKHASELLTTTSLNVSEVAMEVGFIDAAYFSRCFTKQYGVSPSKYAR
jgi:ligand-binding sensor domain-containing protein/signal transduction histidine kinase/DNA-binding response OmpR family regulator